MLRISGWVACFVFGCCGCSRPSAPAGTSADAPKSDPSLFSDSKPAAPPAGTPEEKKPVPTHHWWIGEGPEIRVTLTDKEKLLPSNISILIERRRQEQAKQTHIIIMLHLSPDRSAVKEAIVKIVPPDPNWALSQAERLRLPTKGGKLADPSYLQSNHRADLKDGQFEMNGFVLAPPRNVREVDPSLVPTRELESNKLILKGKLTADTLSGELRLISESPRGITTIPWKGAYLTLSDVEVTKEVQALKEKFVDPESQKLGNERSKVKRLAQELLLPEDTVREWLTPQGPL